MFSCVLCIHEYRAGNLSLFRHAHYKHDVEHKMYLHIHTYHVVVFIALNFFLFLLCPRKSMLNCLWWKYNLTLKDEPNGLVKKIHLNYSVLVQAVVIWVDFIKIVFLKLSKVTVLCKWINTFLLLDAFYRKFKINLKILGFWLIFGNASFIPNRNKY